MADVFAPFAQALADRDAAARAHKARGGKVVGWLTNTSPTELIAAAGAFPLQLAAGADATPLADRYMEDLFDPIVRAVFEGLLAGRYDFVDAVVLPRTSDSVQRLYYYLCEVRRMGEARVPEPLLFDLLHTPWYSSAEYNFSRMGELKAALERVTGTPVTDANLTAAIADSNARRAAMRNLVALRREGRITGVQANSIFAAKGAMAGADFDTALAQVLANPGPVSQAPRIVIAGSPLDTAALHALVEAAGGRVVGDFHEFGEPMIGPDVEAGGDPLRALMAHYHRDVASSRTFPQSPKPLADFARACGAAGVIFNFYAEEEALTWEYPAQRRALEAQGTATICFEGQPHHPDAASLAPVLANFVGGLTTRVPA
ncbi:MAG: 2-hydroxyacyl-CoA dehydratase family protein [Pseudomonadota bacterium]